MGGVTLPIWSSVRLTVARVSVVDCEVGCTVWSDNNSGWTFTYKVGGLNLPICSSVRLTVARLCTVDCEAGGTVWSVNNSGWTANNC